MKPKTILSYLWKLPLCGIAYFLGMAAAGALLPILGFTPPEMPQGTDANTLALVFLGGSMLLALALSFLARRLRGSFVTRWLMLAGFVWVFAALGMVIESFFFMTTGAVSSLQNALFTVLNFLFPALTLSAVVSLLFAPLDPTAQTMRWIPRTSSAWLARGALVLAAYPLIYFTFGLIVQPWISSYYASGQYELTTPTWGQLIPLQLARSLLFLLASLPLLGSWQGSRRGLWLALGFAIFLSTAFMAVITAYWFPWQMRLFHGMELLADALCYAAVLVLFLVSQPSNA